MNHGKNLPSQIAERYQRLERADHGDVAQELRMFHTWASGQPLLHSILEEAAREEPDLDFKTFISRFRSHRGFGWTNSTESGRATLIWKWIELVLEEVEASGRPDSLVLRWGSGVSFANDINRQWRDLSARVLLPLFEYFLDRISDASNTIYVLERYVRRVEWFERERLHAEAIVDT